MFASQAGFQRGIRNALSFTNRGTTAQLSTTQAKIGATSGDFTTTAGNNSITTASVGSFNRGTNPFTIEFWFYQTSIANRFPTVIANNNTTSGSFLANMWACQTHRDLTGQIRDISWSLGGVSTGDAWLKGATQLALDAWHHYAIVRIAADGCSMASSSIDSSGVLTVGTLTNGTITPGLYLTGTNVPAGTYIESNISGSGSGSTWQTNTTTTVASTTITGNNWVLYANGVPDAQGRSSVTLTSLSTNPILIASIGAANLANVAFIGYLDELRMSTVARYFTNFTPPTEPFLDDADTVLLLHFDGEAGTQIWTDDNT
jgi:hypothetical protein